MKQKNALPGRCYKVRLEEEFEREGGTEIYGSKHSLLKFFAASDRWQSSGNGGADLSFIS